METLTETHNPATEALDGVTLPLSTVETVKLDLTNNWTGVDELPFEPIAERVLEMEAEGPNGPEKGALTVRFGKPVYLDGKGWACVFTMSAMGRNHATPAGGADAVQALQMAFHLVGQQLAGMGRRHRITFLGGDELGFAPASASAKGIEACPAMNGSLSV